MGRAIVRNPKVFLMDEPLSNLDAKLRVQMRIEISKIHQRLGATIIYVTHDQTCLLYTSTCQFKRIIAPVAAYRYNIQMSGDTNNLIKMCIRDRFEIIFKFGDSNIILTI